jgi:hypothetical protein
VRPPFRPRATRSLKKLFQPAPDSVVLVATPRISRNPSALTPVATMTAILITRPPSRTFIVSASAATNVYGPSSSGRSRKSRTSSSRSLAITDTCDLDRPVMPSDCTSRSILRVDTPSR